jgi:hypothetical protein
MIRLDHVCPEIVMVSGCPVYLTRTPSPDTIVSFTVPVMVTSETLLARFPVIASVSHENRRELDPHDGMPSLNWSRLVFAHMIVMTSPDRDTCSPLLADAAIRSSEPEA